MELDDVVPRPDHVTRQVRRIAAEPAEPAPELDAAALRAWDAPLSSETRVAATDDASRAAFGRYWRVVRHGSTAVRWEVLTAVELRATG